MRSAAPGKGYRYQDAAHCLTVDYATVGPLGACCRLHGGVIYEPDAGCHPSHTIARQQFINPLNDNDSHMKSRTKYGRQDLDL